MKYWSVRRGSEVFRQLLVAASLLLGACSAAPYVGSHDCKVIAGVQTDDPFYDTCDHCQGRGCGHMDCTAFPCRKERRVVQACQADHDCKELADSRCGSSTEGHGICTLSAAN